MQFRLLSGWSGHGDDDCLRPVVAAASPSVLRITQLPDSLLVHPRSANDRQDIRTSSRRTSARRPSGRCDGAGRWLGLGIAGAMALGLGLMPHARTAACAADRSGRDVRRQLELGAVRHHLGLRLVGARSLASRVRKQTLQRKEPRR